MNTAHKKLVEEKLTLRPLQKEAVEKMIHFLKTNPEHGVYNASEMGTGKCAMTIGCINQLKPPHILIICPSVVKLNWRDEIRKWLFYPYDVAIWTINSSKEIKNQFGLSDFTIISYELARTPIVLKWLLKQRVDLLVLDEAHRVKSTKSKTKKAILDTLWPKIPYRILLSGTPFTNSIEDCWTTFSRLAPKEFSDYYKFVNTYCYCERTPWGDKYYGLKNHEKLREIIRENFFVRYTKDEMAPELPEKIWQRISLPFDEFAVKPTKEEKEEHALYIKLLEEAIGAGRAIPHPPKHITHKRIEQTFKKLPAIIELCKNSVDNKVPTIVFFTYLDPLREFIKQMTSYAPSVITGALTANERYIQVNRFQVGDTQLIISQIHAGGIGINLQRAEHVILAELDYSPAVIAQAADRAHRINTKHPVTIYYPIVEGTIEEQIERAVMGKAKIFKKVVD